jgi:hypothetical protein
MKPKSILLWVSAFAFTFGIISCGKDEVTKIPPVSDGQDTTVIPPKQDTVYYVIDTTKKIEIDEILYLEEYNMAAVSGIWRSAAYGNGRWVAVGNRGVVATSTNGKTWSTQIVGGTSSYWDGVAYGDGRWIAAGKAENSEGDKGKIAISTNSTSWSTQDVDIPMDVWCGVACGNGRWVMVDWAYSKIATSTDNGTSWNIQTVGFPSGGWYDVAYGNGRWIAVSKGGKITTSIDGISWSIQQVGTAAWNGIAVKTD